MIYLKTENENGVITFAPLNDESIYVLCKECGHMVKVDDPRIIAWDAASFEEWDICEECYESLLEIEEEKRFEENIEKRIAALKASGEIK
ncbi:MAG: hypothetical protein RR670_01940 [Erysipelotrichaceae bacterium]